MNAAPHTLVFLANAGAAQEAVLQDGVNFNDGMPVDSLAALFESFLRRGLLRMVSPCFSTVGCMAASLFLREDRACRMYGF